MCGSGQGGKAGGRRAWGGRVSGRGWLPLIRPTSRPPLTCLPSLSNTTHLPSLNPPPVPHDLSLRGKERKGRGREGPNPSLLPSPHPSICGREGKGRKGRVFRPFLPPSVEGREREEGGIVLTFPLQPLPWIPPGALRHTRSLGSHSDPWNALVVFKITLWFIG